MGLLAESKIRRKINNDPNNTKWSRDTTTFGQKILRSQGWQPGEFLGAQNAPHSELHTAANASFIRVVLKDDMKGLGFNRAKEDQVTGLDVFQDLLSRLNGKSEELVEVDQQARLAVKTHHYVERKWGAMRFVYGGLLIGDEMKDLADGNTSKEASSDSESESESEEKAEPMEVDAVEKESKESKKEKKSKKRKAVDDDDASEQESESKSKKRRKEEKDEAKAKKKEKKEKKEKKAKKNKSKRSVEASDDESDERAKKQKSKKDKTGSPEDSEEDKAKDSKKSKKDKKEKKDKKKRRKEEAETSDSATSALPSLVGSGTSTPTGTGTSTPQGSRNFVRSRFIAQKRQAVMDTKALAQIFMIKA